MGKLCNLLVRLGILVLPFVYWTKHFSPYEVPKAWLIWGIALGSWVTTIVTKPEKSEKSPSRTLVMMVMGMITWIIISSVTAGDFWQSWWGNSYRSDGLLTLLAMLIVGLTLSVEENIFKLIALGNLGLSLWMLGTWQMEAALTLGHPNLLAGFLAVTLPSLQTLGKGHKISIFIALVALWLTGSWGGILMGTVWVLYLILQKRPKMLLATLVVTLLTIGWLYNREYQARAIPGYIVAEARPRILAKAVIAIGQKPVLGWGWAQFDQAFARIDYPTHYLLDAYVDRTHASILEYGVAGGVPALLLYCAIAGLTIRALLLSREKTDLTLGYMVILYLILSQTNVTTVAIDWLLWLGIGRAMRRTNS